MILLARLIPLLLLVLALSALLVIVIYVPARKVRSASQNQKADKPAAKPVEEKKKEEKKKKKDGWPLSGLVALLIVFGIPSLVVYEGIQTFADMAKKSRQSVEKGEEQSWSNIEVIHLSSELCRLAWPTGATAVKIIIPSYEREKGYQYELKSGSLAPFTGGDEFSETKVIIGEQLTIRALNNQKFDVLVQWKK